MVYPAPVLPGEPVLLAVGPDAGCTHQTLLEVSVNGRPSHRVQALQMPCCCHVHTLQRNSMLKQLARTIRGLIGEADYIPASPSLLKGWMGEKKPPLPP